DGLFVVEVIEENKLLKKIMKKFFEQHSVPKKKEIRYFLDEMNNFMIEAPEECKSYKEKIEVDNPFIKKWWKAVQKNHESKMPCQNNLIRVIRDYITVQRGYEPAWLRSLNGYIHLRDCTHKDAPSRNPNVLVKENRLLKSIIDKFFEKNP